MAKPAFIVINEFGGVFQVNRPLFKSELDSVWRGEATVLRVENGTVQEMNSTDHSKWTDLPERI